jgi:hypothetical protein
VIGFAKRLAKGALGTIADAVFGRVDGEPYISRTSVEPNARPMVILNPTADPEAVQAIVEGLYRRVGEWSQ